LNLLAAGVSCAGAKVNGDRAAAAAGAHSVNAPNLHFIRQYILPNRTKKSGCVKIVTMNF